MEKFIIVVPKLIHMPAVYFDRENPSTREMETILYLSFNSERQPVERLLVCPNRKEGAMYGENNYHFSKDEDLMQKARMLAKGTSQEGCTKVCILENYWEKDLQNKYHEMLQLEERTNALYRRIRKLKTENAQLHREIDLNAESILLKGNIQGLLVKK